ncbi:MAG: pyridoxamine kinase [Lachnospiraceae bacterium]|nr:pyridoxamine kinase [Lachnospiraceae bacterium]
MKRIISIQDVSCLGKCSLTVALPIISAMGVETTIIPTAVLSTHTMFQGFTFRDLTDDMDPIKDHWKKEGFKFDAIYTGYLGSERQINIVADYFDTFKSEGTVIVMDPAMADNGKLYPGFDNNFAKNMASLCAKADIILPNISEACLMLGEAYPGEDADEETVKGLLLKLSELGARYSVITGTEFADGTFGFTGYDKETKEFFKYGTKKVPWKSHGTGDVFASAATGALMNGLGVFDSLKVAADYTCACINNTYEDPDKVDYAVNFEAEIPYLLKLINK